MAGSYPDAPGFRMPVDIDGSTGLWISNANAITTLSQAEVRTMLDESETSIVTYGSQTSASYCILFPELRDIVATYVRLTNDFGGAISATFQKSVDTTTGIDGTWTTWAGPAVDTTGPTSPRYRTAIQTAAASGVRGLKINYTYGGGNQTWMRCWHVYGGPSSGQNPDRLALWHPTLDQAIAATHFDLGNASRSSTIVTDFRVKNLSATKTATTITLSTDALTDATPTILSQLALSSNGGSSYASTATIATLAPGAISSVMKLRAVLTGAAALGLTSPRVIATPASMA